MFDGWCSAAVAVVALAAMCGVMLKQAGFGSCVGAAMSPTARALVVLRAAGPRTPLQ